MVYTRKAERVPASSFAEPSEPSQLRPEDKPKDTLTGEQEENPQVVMHMQGRQSGDEKGTNAGSRSGGTDVGSPKEPLDQKKRKDAGRAFGGIRKSRTKL